MGRARRRTVRFLTPAAAAAAALVLGAGHAAAAPPSRSPLSGTQVRDQPVTRVAGPDRIDTAVAASRTALPRGSAGGAVLARADDYADALAGTALAARYGPLLLTRGTRLDPRVRAELERVLAPRVTVFILGTEDVIGAGVAAELRSMGHDVTRLGGADRYATAAAIAEFVSPEVGTPGRPCTYALATGLDFPDALTAASTGLPLLFSRGYTMPPATLREIARCRGDADGRALHLDVPVRLTAVGGPAALAGELDPATTYFRSDVDTRVSAVAGRDRYETSALAIRLRLGTGEEPAQTVVVATGSDFPDALVGAGTLAHSDLNLYDGRPPVVVLTARHELQQRARELLADPRLPTNGAFVMGGADVLTDAVAGQVRTAVNAVGPRVP
ncbi:hypothetical protein NUM3379_26750 [Kineococcus sp. NUM-3379]